MPRSENWSNIAGAHAEPPMTTRFKVDRVKLFECRYWSNPSQTVGTPLVNVTRSVSKSSYKLAPSSCAPGSTSLAPTRHAAYGKPQENTWNIGVTGIIT